MSQKNDFLHELEVVMHSRYRLIFINTKEEHRVGALLRLLADHMNLPFFTWSRVKGLVRQDQDSPSPVYNSHDINIALGHIESSSFPAIYHFKGMLDFLEDINITEKLKNAVLNLTNRNATVIVTGYNPQISETLNDVSKLLPEFTRKGRFDEIFFVDLPKVESRKLIFEIHLRKRKKIPMNLILKSLPKLPMVLQDRR